MKKKREKTPYLKIAIYLLIVYYELRNCLRLSLECYIIHNSVYHFSYTFLFVLLRRFQQLTINALCNIIHNSVYHVSYTLPFVLLLRFQQLTINALANTI